MKFYKTLGLYKASNVTYEPTTRKAFSYSWWQFVGVFNGKTVFNRYGYSKSTQKHQSKVRRVMGDLGHLSPIYHADIEVEVPEGLQVHNLAEKATTYAEGQIKWLQEKQAKGKPGSWAYQHREGRIQFFLDQIAWAKSLAVAA